MLFRSPTPPHPTPPHPTDYKRIYLADTFGAAEHRAHKVASAQKAEEWANVSKGYMARRIQQMYRVWKARKFRQATLWRADLLVERKRTAARKRIGGWLDRFVRGGRVRKGFGRELGLAVVKVWDVGEGQFFWFNQVRGCAVW